MRAFPAFVALSVSASVVGCGAKNPNVVYAPLPDVVYQATDDAARDAVINVVHELGFVVSTVSDVEDMTVVATAERPSDHKTEDGLECRKEWKGIIFGGWVEDVGGILLTVQISPRNGGVSIRLRESGVGGCAATGYWGKEFFELIATRLSA